MEREWAMRFALELPWLFSHPNERRGFPSFGQCYCQVQSPQRSFHIDGVSKRLFGAHLWSLFLILSMFSSTVHLADIRPHSLPPSPTSPPPAKAQASALMLSISKLIMHRHVCIAFFRFPFVNLAHITYRVLIAVFPNDALISPPLYLRRHVIVAGIPVSTSGHHSSSSSKHHRRSIIICPRQTIGPSYLLITPGTCTMPAIRSATATPTLVTFTSTI